MRHISNVKVIKILKLLDKMDFSKDYDYTQIYNNSKKSESDYDNHHLSLISNAPNNSPLPKII